MHLDDIEKLRGLTNFNALVDYLRDELDWPIEVTDAEELVFDYALEELGIDKQHAVNIRSIKQIRPLVAQQPWGIFYLEFERKRLPVVVLRRILRAFVARRRQLDPDRPVWQLSDLMFISAQGDADTRGVAFAHFQQSGDGLPELRTFSWDLHETHFYYIKQFNLNALQWPADEADHAAWRSQWRTAFTVKHRYAITTSQILAKEMARHALTIHDLITEVYGLETKTGALHALYENFKDLLLHDLSPDTFADMLAQTVAYGLFSAATQSHDLTLDSMVDLIPNTNPFLKDLLTALFFDSPQNSPPNTLNTRNEEETKDMSFSRVSRADDFTPQNTPNTRNEENEVSFSRVPRVSRVDLDELGIGELVEMLRQTDVDAILRDFGRQTGSGKEDPVIHFYELFLSEYDKAQKVQRGVFYTPDPVVSFIVRSVDALLKSEFGLADGLADTTTDPTTSEPLVQILDPATGTGTFLAHVIDRIEQTVKAQPGVNWDEYVAHHLLPRLNGFELMMAPLRGGAYQAGLETEANRLSFQQPGTIARVSV